MEVERGVERPTDQRREPISAEEVLALLGGDALRPALAALVFWPLRFLEGLTATP
jgi:hypothetical protein